jgi:hypothetical protein
LEASSAEATAALEVENFFPASTGTETERPHLNWTEPQPPAQAIGGLDPVYKGILAPHLGRHNPGVEIILGRKQAQNAGARDC